jgi:hypothetical protein
MNEWFGPDVAQWFPWLSLMSLTALVAPWVAKGRHKRLVNGIYITSIAFGVLLLAAGLIARFLEQPQHVSGPLMLAGVVITVVFAATMPVIVQGYAKAEERKMLARDI